MEDQAKTSNGAQGAECAGDRWTILISADASQRNRVLEEIAKEGSVAVDGLTQLSAAEALAALKAGKALVGVEVQDLQLHGAHSFPIRIVRSILHRPVFSGDYQQSVELIACELRAPKIQNGSFAQGLVISGSNLGRALFQNITISGNFKADNACFTREAFFKDVTFAQEARFWGCTFDDWIQFEKCQCKGKFDFRSAHCEEGLNLNKCRFLGDVLMRGTAIAKKFDMCESAVEQLLDLSKMKLQDFAYLNTVAFGPMARIALAYVIAERLVLDPQAIEGKLLSEQSGDYQQAAHEYGLLKKVFGNLNQYEQEDWAFYRFKVNQRKAKFGPQHPWYQRLLGFSDWLFLDVGCRYGTDPIRSIRAALVIMGVFALIYTLGVRNQSFIVEKPLVGENPTGWANSLVFGTVTSISVFTAGFTADKFTLARGWMLLPLAVEALMGTLLWGFFIVSFSRKVVR